MATRRARERVEKRLKERQSVLEKRYLQRNEQMTKKIKSSLGNVDGFLGVFGLEKTAVFELMRAAAMEGDETGIKFCNGVRATPDVILEHQAVQDLCAMFQIPPSAVIGVVVTQLSKFKNATASLKAAMALDDIVEASIASAKNLSSNIGLEDRKLLLRQQKFIVDEPKGPLVNIDQRKIEVNGASSEFEKLIKRAAERPALSAAPTEGVIDAETTD